MTTNEKFQQLPEQWQESVRVLIRKMCGKSHIADVFVEDSDLAGYDFKVTVCKYNTVKGWATIGYLRNDLFKGGIWRLTYNPRKPKGAARVAGKTGTFNA